MTTSNAQSPEHALVVVPEVLQAPRQDVEIAKASRDVEPRLETLQQSEIEDLKNRLGNATEVSSAVGPTVQLPPAWLEQDDNLRPVIVNPLPYPVQIIYVDRGDPRTLTIQPSTSALIDVARGVYDITWIVLDTLGGVRGKALGSIVSGPAPASIPDVEVVVDNSSMTSKPFRVGKITDLGEDPDVGERKVLLDGGTPAWGHWTETAPGQRQFEIDKTQQLPGIDAPAEGPLPGYRLVADSESIPPTDVLLIVVAALLAAVAIGAVIVHTRKQNRRRRRDRHPDTRVEARSRPGSMLAVTVRDTPAGGEAAHAVRLATRSNPRTLTVNEVSDDHSDTA